MYATAEFIVLCVTAEKVVFRNIIIWICMFYFFDTGND